MSKEEAQLGAAIDIGTMNFVAARKVGKAIKTTRIRDAFLDLPATHKRMLKLSKTSYVEIGDKLLVLGDEALETANLFNREARRPLSRGMISPGEIDAQEVMALMIKYVLGEAKENERCCFSVPAPALDIPGSDVIYHAAILKKILTELGYDAQSHNEAQAIIFSECARDNFSGIGISYGSGMTNVCLSYNAMSALEFSLGRSGDWVDSGAAKAVSTTAAKICAIKEEGIDINNPTSREVEAIALFISTLIDYSIENIINHFHKTKNEIQIPKPIPIVIGGGTSLANGFTEMFQERFQSYKSKFPVEISEIRSAKDPMTTVATGLLLLAQMED
jgi:hypothetical protein